MAAYTRRSRLGAYGEACGQNLGGRDPEFLWKRLSMFEPGLVVAGAGLAVSFVGLRTLVYLLLGIRPRYGAMARKCVSESLLA